MSRDSGAGAYVHSFGTGARSCLRSSSVNGEVVRALVATGLFLPELHEDVVQERRRADPVAIGREPVRAERLVHEHEMLDRGLRDAYPTVRLEADDAAGLLMDVADRLEHAKRDRERRGARDLPGRGLDEVGAELDRAARVGDLEVDRVLAGREARRNGGDVHARALEALDAGRDEVLVH